MNSNQEVILKVENLKKYFPVRRGVFQRQVGQVKAVDDISFSVFKGETLGIVGESGCGKTTAGRTIIRLYEPTDGRVYYYGKDITQVEGSSLRELRQKMQMIFQDPYASLNPRMKVENIVGEPLKVQGFGSNVERRERIAELLSMVGLNPRVMNRYPHEFSGGQRQRIGIARALTLNPDLVICDEPISALDVSIQAQVINLLQDLQEEIGLTYIFIAHDLSMVRHISDRVIVMYLGKIVELTNQKQLFDNPLHPYTKALLSAIPVPDPDVEATRQRISLEGRLPSPANPPKGCNFNTRCPLADTICKDIEPELIEVEAEHFVSCHLVGSTKD